MLTGKLLKTLEMKMRNVGTPQTIETVVGSVSLSD